MYSFRNDSWKEISDRPWSDDEFSLDSSSFGYVDGCYYWGQVGIMEHIGKFVISFDFATESFSTFPVGSKQ